MARGKFEREVEELANQLFEAKGQIKTLEACANDTGADMREIKTDLKWIKSLLGDLARKMGAVPGPGET